MAVSAGVRFSETAYGRSKRRTEGLVRVGLAAMAAAMVLPLLALILYLLAKAWPALSLEFLLDVPKNGMRAGGIWSALVGTVYLVLCALAVSAPIGVMAAIYMNE